MRIRKVLFENLSLKIASVIFSIVLWMFVTSRGQSEVSLDVPIEFRNIPSGYEIVSYSVKNVNVNIKGQERLIKSVKPSDVHVYVDLKKAKKGENLYYISSDDIELSRAFTVTNVKPSYIRIFVEETIKKSVKVVPIITGYAANGYFIKSVDVEPRMIEIEGIRSEVDKVSYVKTEPIDITGLNDSIFQEVRIDLSGKNVKTATNYVRVNIIIKKR
jgi:YbbR domain-containing protein